MTKTTVTKIGKHYVVEGIIAVIGGRIVNEPFARAFRTSREAEYEASQIDRRNAECLEYVEEVRAARVASVSSYLAVRAARRPVEDKQLSLF